ncbi:unnamed protein product [Protopolystoma xenopodis]|uniref:Uncharacterized protein n=1 Tax=Protopolystoma xenopodis TaxID=117903 RepID=A0A3S4ZZR9_9PLAT|nr:unnamed protein product [Protopolystoma xenopodis]
MFAALRDPAISFPVSEFSPSSTLPPITSHSLFLPSISGLTSFTSSSASAFALGITGNSSAIATSTATNPYGFAYPSMTGVTAAASTCRTSTCLPGNSPTTAVDLNPSYSSPCTTQVMRTVEALALHSNQLTPATWDCLLSFCLAVCQAVLATPLPITPQQFDDFLLRTSESGPSSGSTTTLVGGAGSVLTQAGVSAPASIASAAPSAAGGGISVSGLGADTGASGPANMSIVGAGANSGYYYSGASTTGKESIITPGSGSSKFDFFNHSLYNLNVQKAC